MGPLNMFLFLGGISLLMMNYVYGDCGTCKKQVVIPALKPLLSKIIIPPIDLCNKPCLSKSLDLSFLKSLDLCSLKDPCHKSVDMCSKDNDWCPHYGKGTGCCGKCKKGCSKGCGHCGQSCGCKGYDQPCGYRTLSATIDNGPSHYVPPPSYSPPAYSPPSYHPSDYSPPSYSPPHYSPPSYNSPSHKPSDYSPPDYSPPRPSYNSPSYDSPSPNYKEPSYTPPRYGLSKHNYGHDDLYASPSEVNYQYDLPCDDLETSESNTVYKIEQNAMTHDKIEIQSPPVEKDIELNLEISLPPGYEQQYLNEFIKKLQIVEEDVVPENSYNDTEEYTNEGDFNDMDTDLYASESSIYPYNYPVNKYDNHYFQESKTAYYDPPTYRNDKRLEETQPEEIHSDLAANYNPYKPYNPRSYIPSFIPNKKVFSDNHNNIHIPRRGIAVQNYLLKNDPYKLDSNVNNPVNKNQNRPLPSTPKGLNPNYENLMELKHPNVNKPVFKNQNPPPPPPPPKGPNPNYENLEDLKHPQNKREGMYSEKLLKNFERKEEYDDEIEGSIESEEVQDLPPNKAIHTRLLEPSSEEEELESKTEKLSLKPSSNLTDKKSVPVPFTQKVSKVEEESDENYDPNNLNKKLDLLPVNKPSLNNNSRVNTSTDKSYNSKQQAFKAPVNTETNYPKPRFAPQNIKTNLQQEKAPLQVPKIPETAPKQNKYLPTKNQDDKREYRDNDELLEEYDEDYPEEEEYETPVKNTKLIQNLKPVNKTPIETQEQRKYTEENYKENTRSQHSQSEKNNMKNYGLHLKFNRGSQYKGNSEINNYPNRNLQQSPSYVPKPTVPSAGQYRPLPPTRNPTASTLPYEPESMEVPPTLKN